MRALLSGRATSAFGIEQFSAESELQKEILDSKGEGARVVESPIS